MTATRKDVDGWIEAAKEIGATHIISVCDTFSYDDYPVYVMPGEDLEKKKIEYNGKEMQRINEVITINGDEAIEER